MAGEILRMAKWQAARPVINRAQINTPDNLTVIVFQLEGDPGESGVLVRHNTKKTEAFIDFHVEDRPFGSTVDRIKKRCELFGKNGGLL